VLNGFCNPKKVVKVDKSYLIDYSKSNQITVQNNRVGRSQRFMTLKASDNGLRAIGNTATRATCPKVVRTL
jgi:hypothetical protein